MAAPTAADRALYWRIVAAAKRAEADGRAVHHVSLSAADWPASLPTITLKPALRASVSVLWAMDTRGGWKLTPYALDPAEAA